MSDSLKCNKILLLLSIPHSTAVHSLSCPAVCDPMNCSTPGFPVLHYLIEFAQIYFHWIGDAIQHLTPCHPLLFLPSIFPSIRVFSNEPALRIRWANIGASTSASVLPMNIQGWFPLGLTGLISLQSKNFQESSAASQFESNQFFSAQLSLWSKSHVHT